MEQQEYNEEKIQDWMYRFKKAVSFYINELSWESTFSTRRTDLSDRSKKVWYRVNTTTIRKEIARNLGELQIEAMEICRRENLSLKEKEKWVNLNIQLSKGINSILNKMVIQETSR